MNNVKIKAQKTNLIISIMQTKTYNLYKVLRLVICLPEERRFHKLSVKGFKLCL